MLYACENEFWQSLNEKFAGLQERGTGTGILQWTVNADKYPVTKLRSFDAFAKKEKGRKKWKNSGVYTRSENEEEISFACQWASSRRAKLFYCRGRARFTIFISYRINLQVSLIWIELLKEKSLFFPPPSPILPRRRRTMHKRERPALWPRSEFFQLMPPCCSEI